jgi:hypothetical protein
VALSDIFLGGWKDFDRLICALNFVFSFIPSSFSGGVYFASLVFFPFPYPLWF